MRINRIIDLTNKRNKKRDLSPSSLHSIIRLFDYSINSPSSHHSIIRLFDYSIIRKAARGFTLIELLVVMGIMGLLGGTAVGGYRAMVRGMEKRGTMQTANAFIRAAYQRAQIDRQPVVVYFWNETLQESTDDKSAVVVGKAVAVRRFGRISRVDGDVLVDEFGDLNCTYMTQGEEEEATSGGASGGTSNSHLDLYEMSDITAQANGSHHSYVQPLVARHDETVQFLGGAKSDDSDESAILAYGFRISDRNGVNWRQGSAYGFEFQRLQLPRGYIFGSSFSTSVNNPIVEAGKLVFDVGLNNNSGRNTGGVIGGSTVAVYALHQQGSTLSPVKVADSARPDREL